MEQKMRLKLKKKNAKYKNYIFPLVGVCRIVYWKNLNDGNNGKRRKTCDAHAIRAPNTAGKSSLCVYLVVVVVSRRKKN